MGHIKSVKVKVTKIASPIKGRKLTVAGLKLGKAPKISASISSFLKPRATPAWLKGSGNKSSLTSLQKQNIIKAKIKTTKK